MAQQEYRCGLCCQLYRALQHTDLLSMQQSTLAWVAEHSHLVLCSSHSDSMHGNASFCSQGSDSHMSYLSLAGTETVKQMLCMLSMLRPLLAGVAATFRRLSLQLLRLHKGVAKLGYIVTSLLSGVMQEGYCTASEAEGTEAGVSPSLIGFF